MKIKITAVDMTDYSHLTNNGLLKVRCLGVSLVMICINPVCT